jgi:hypothetical protein
MRAVVRDSQVGLDVFREPHPTPRSKILVFVRESELLMGEHRSACASSMALACPRISLELGGS